jgi:hypothetical protein
METSQQSTVTALYTVRFHGEDCVPDVPCTGYICYSGTVTAVSSRSYSGSVGETVLGDSTEKLILVVSYSSDIWSVNIAPVWLIT